MTFENGLPYVPRGSDSFWCNVSRVDMAAHNFDLVQSDPVQWNGPRGAQPENDDSVALSGADEGETGGGVSLMLAGLLALAGIASKMMSYAPGARLLLSGTLGPTAAFGLTEAERREIVDTIRTHSSPQDTVVVYPVGRGTALRISRGKPEAGDRR